MSKLPKRYDFSNTHLPVQRPDSASVPANESVAPQVIHVYEAPRSSAGKWIAAGLGGGALLVAASIAAVAVAVAAVSIAICAVVLLMLVREVRGGRR